MTSDEFEAAWQSIVAELSANGGGSSREIAARTDVDLDAVRECLEWLRRRRKVRHNGVLGVWWLASGQQMNADE